MNPSVTLDHVVIVVDDLPRAKRNFGRAGFTVVDGGINGPSQNALILFQDGSYIELITTVSPWMRRLFKVLNALGLFGLVANRMKPELRRYLRWFASSEGLTDWCLGVADIEQSLTELAQAGVSVTPSFATSRRRPNGEVATWKLAAPVDEGLPFLIEDTSARSIRVPIDENCVHANRAIGIAGVSVDERVFNAFQGGFQKSGAVSSDDSIAGAKNWSIRAASSSDLRKMTLSLWSGAPENTTIPRTLVSNAEIDLLNRHG